MFSPRSAAAAWKKLRRAYRACRVRHNMTPFHVTAGLIARVDRFGATFNLARFSALAVLPENPFSVEIRRFGTGEGAAVKVRHPLLRGKNRVYGFSAADSSLLDELLDFYSADALSCTVFVPYGEMNPTLFQLLARAGFWSSGTGIVPVFVPEDHIPPLLSEIDVRVSGGEEKDLYLDLFQEAFAEWPEQEPEYRAVQWAEDSLPGGVRYIAESDGKPVGMASFPVLGRVGHLGTCGVLPNFRGRGVHSALIRQRLRDALSLDCDLVVGGNSPGTTAFRNFERAGLRLVPTGSAWRESPAT